MRLVQKKGPFKRNSSFKVDVSPQEYVHIGIQNPKSQPISANIHDKMPFTVTGIDGTVSNRREYDLSKTIVQSHIDPDITVQQGSHGSGSYFINRAGILEFDTELGTSVTVTFLKDMPAETIIDLVYDDSGGV